MKKCTGEQCSRKAAEESEFCSSHKNEKSRGKKKTLSGKSHSHTTTISDILDFFAVDEEDSDENEEPESSGSPSQSDEKKKDFATGKYF